MGTIMKVIFAMQLQRVSTWIGATKKMASTVMDCRTKRMFFSFCIRVPARMPSTSALL